MNKENLSPLVVKENPKYSDDMKEKLKIDLSRVTLRQLRALSALASTGSVSAAARALGVTPPAVSMQLRQLEGWVGLPVMQRTSRGFVLTEAGSELLMTARRIDAALDEAGQALRSLHGEAGGRVVVGGVSTAKYFLPEVVASFSRRWPDVSVHLRIGNRDDIVEALRDYAIDLAITGRPPRDFPITRAVVGPHPYVVIARPDHPRLGGPRFPFAELADDVFLMREPGSGTRTLAESLFREAGLQTPQVRDMGSNESIKQGVMAGLGVAVISGHTVAVELESERLVTLPVEGVPVLRSWYVTRRRDKRLLPPAQAFWDFMASEGGAFLPHPPDRLVGCAP